jgi:hypothetical protein
MCNKARHLQPQAALQFRQEETVMEQTRRTTTELKGTLQDAVQQLRNSISEVEDPQAKALYETSAEVLLGLINAFDDFQEGTEEAWRR